MATSVYFLLTPELHITTAVNLHGLEPPPFLADEIGVRIGRVEDVVVASEMVECVSEVREINTMMKVLIDASKIWTHCHVDNNEIASPRSNGYGSIFRRTVTYVQSEEGFCCGFAANTMATHIDFQSPTVSGVRHCAG
jgi:hypothetical protein